LLSWTTVCPCPIAVMCSMVLLVAILAVTASLTLHAVVDFQPHSQHMSCRQRFMWAGRWLMPSACLACFCCLGRGSFVEEAMLAPPPLPNAVADPSQLGSLQDLALAGKGGIDPDGAIWHTDTRNCLSTTLQSNSLNCCL
jgi:hypothetical protein